jgi:ribonuclease HII
MKLIFGMDEAGRGPVIGPLVFSIVGATEKELQCLEEIGVEDSKKISAKRRVEFANFIKENVSHFDIRVCSVETIDNRGNMSLNELEVNEFKELLKPYRDLVEKIYLDAADVNATRFGLNFSDLVAKERIISEHKADGKYTVVGAASILAKVERDKIVENLRYEFSKQYPELPVFSKGYPTDATPFLESYFLKFGELPQYARKSWKTSMKIIEKYQSTVQKNLTMFFD